MSHVLRRFTDAQVVEVPSREHVETIQERETDVRIEILATQGKQLSQELQDGHSYRYGIINAGGRDHEDAMQVIERCRRQLNFVFGD